MIVSTRRDGFALPMVILVIGFMTAGVLAAFTRTGTEFQLVDNQQLQTDAFAIAEAGLQQYLATGRVTPATATYTYANGTAVVTATQMRAATATVDAIYLISSVGSVTGSPNRPPATRTVAQFATLPRSGMHVTSALTSYAGVDKSGASGSFVGTDQCGLAPTLAGSQIPSGMWDGHSGMASGSPPIDATKTQAQLLAETKIDWAGITNTASPAITPDIVICGSGSTGLYGPCGSWPSFSDPNYWPVILVDGSTDLNRDGRGTLIVTHNLTLKGGDEWDGIMLVGGILRDNGTGSQDGAAVAGLNLLTGGTIGGYSADMNGTKRYQYNSCNVANASKSFVRLSPMSNAWVDNWASW